VWLSPVQNFVSVPIGDPSMVIHGDLWKAMVALCLSHRPQRNVMRLAKGVSTQVE